jgi:DNA-binding ferritin-like protein (Dps family)
MSGEQSSGKGQSSNRMDEAREILRTLRQCRSRLNKLRLDHAAAYADIAVQLLKQSIATEENEQENIKAT